MIQIVKNGVDQGLDFKIKSFLGNEMKIDKKWIFLLTGLFNVDDFIEMVAFISFRNISNLPCLQDIQAIIVFKGLNYLLGVVDAHLNLLSQRIQCFLHQIMKKCQLVEDVFIRFF